MTTPLLGMTTKMGLFPALYVLSSNRKPEPSISSTSSSGTANQDLTQLFAGPTLIGCTIDIGFPQQHRHKVSQCPQHLKTHTNNSNNSLIDK